MNEDDREFSILNFEIAIIVLSTEDSIIISVHY